MGDLISFNKMHAYVPFSDEAVNFLNSVSEILRSDTEAKKYSDIQTFAIWARKSSILKIKASYGDLSNRLGRGITFHIAPSNIPLMFMFSFAVSLLSGNSNIIRLSSKDFEQTPILIKALKEAGAGNMLAILRYGHDKEITDYLSSICRSRIIWGGDGSIAEIRKSEIPVSAIDMPFYDRFSFSIINPCEYLKCQEKMKLAERFYNDTYLTDQNACTSPQLVVWLGNDKEKINKAKEAFWSSLEDIVNKKYVFQNIQAVDKLAAVSRLGASGIKGKISYKNMKLFRVELDTLPKNIKNFRCPGGYFYEYVCENYTELKEISSTETQTISYFGIDKNNIFDFLKNENCTGVDRIVPIGATMNFGTKWDGFDFIYSLSRIIGS